MDKLIKNAVYNQTLTFFTVFLIAVMGIAAFISLPQNEDPSIEVRMVQIITSWPGAIPEDIELYITKPIEKSVSKQDSVSEITSKSMPGVSVINVTISEYAPQTEVVKAFQQIRNYVSDIKPTLPEDIAYIAINDRFGETSAYVLGLISKEGKRSYRDLEAIGERIEDKIKTIEGVGDFDFYGIQQEKIYIDFSTNHFTSLGITPIQVVQAIKSQNIQIAQPGINISDKRVLIETTGTYKTIQQIKNTIVYTDKEGNVYRIKDLKAKVYLGYQDPQKMITRVNKEKSIIMAFSMKRGNHIVRWGNKIDKALEEIKKDLPSDVKIKIIAHQPSGVKKSVNNFMENLYQAVFFVILVIGIGMGLRNAGIVAIAIPLIMLATFAIMAIFKRELQQMSINALIISLGMVIDNAIVITDNVNRYIEMGYTKEEAAYKGSKEVKIALLSGTLTTVAAFLPLAFLPGNLGEYVMDIPLVISISLFVSYFVAMFVTPTTSAFLLPSKEMMDKKKEEKEKKKALKGQVSKPSKFVKFYYNLIDAVHSHKTITVGILLILFVVSLYSAFIFIPISFFPPAEKTQFVIDLWLPDGWDLTKTKEKTTEIENFLESLKKEKITQGNRPIDYIIGKSHVSESLVKNYACYIGGGGPRFFISISPQPNMLKYAHIVVNTSSPQHTKEVIKRFNKFSAQHITGAIVEIKELETGPVVDAPIQVRIAGTEIEDLKRLANEIENIMFKTPGITTYYNDYGYDTNVIKINIDQGKAKMLNLSSEDIAYGVLMSFEGYPISRYKAPERQIDINIRVLKTERKDISDLKGIIFTSSKTGEKHRLDDFAILTMDTETSTIARKDQRRTITINAYVKGMLPSEMLKILKPKIDKVKLPQGYQISYGGQEEESGKAFGHLVVLGSFAILLLLLILAYQFKSIKIALAIYVAIPFALIGSIFGLIVMKQPLGFMSALGIISLAGIVVNNAILMIEYIQDNLREGKELLDSIKKAGIVRFRPIILTTVTTLVGLLPLALFGGALFSPMCWVIIFGLVFSTLLTLLVIPMFYVMFGGSKDSMRIIAMEKMKD